VANCASDGGKIAPDQKFTIGLLDYCIHPTIELRPRIERQVDITSGSADFEGRKQTGEQ
jgi:hypothetical protein